MVPPETPVAVPVEAAGLQRCSPVAGPVEVLAAPGESRTAARFTVTDAEPVLPGHYPGFPIFPGVCLVECAHTSALATAPAGAAGRLDLAEIESTRFTGPVFPGDTVTVAIDWKALDGGGWRCKARLTSQRGDAASVRLRYRSAEGPDTSGEEAAL